MLNEEHGSCSAVGAPGVAGGDVMGEVPSPKSAGVFGDMGSVTNNETTLSKPKFGIYFLNLPNQN